MIITRAVSLILIGTLFGAGLALSGMLNPAKVAGFLDLFGVWDPSLAFVMGGDDQLFFGKLTLLFHAVWLSLC